MNETSDHLKQDQGVLEEPIRDLEEEDEEAALDELAEAAQALGIRRSQVSEPDGGVTEVG